MKNYFYFIFNYKKGKKRSTNFNKKRSLWSLVKLSLFFGDSNELKKYMNLQNKTQKFFMNGCHKIYIYILIFNMHIYLNKIIYIYEGS